MDNTIADLFNDKTTKTSNNTDNCITCCNYSICTIISKLIDLSDAGILLLVIKCKHYKKETK